MSAGRTARMNVDQFLSWAEQQPGRFELENGEVVAMSPERSRHAEAKFLVQSALAAAIHRANVPCRMLPDGMTVRISAHRAYEPDALVYCGPKLPGDAVEVPAPVIVVEVLSPGTATRDISVKLAGYFEVESIEHYLIIDPEHRLVTHHARGGDVVVTRTLSTGSVRLDPPGLEFELAGVFPEADS